jgi:hypothetical protein
VQFLQHAWQSGLVVIDQQSNDLLHCDFYFTVWTSHKLNSARPVGEPAAGEEGVQPRNYHMRQSLGVCSDPSELTLTRTIATPEAAPRQHTPAARSKLARQGSETLERMEWGSKNDPRLVLSWITEDANSLNYRKFFEKNGAAEK